MALNIKNKDVERLATEMSQLTGDTKTEAIRRALEERRARLAVSTNGGDRRTRLIRLLETEIWPRIPTQHIGRTLTRSEEDEILGYGPEGV